MGGQKQAKGSPKMARSGRDNTKRKYAKQAVSSQKNKEKHVKMNKKQGDPLAGVPRDGRVMAGRSSISKSKKRSS